MHDDYRDDDNDLDWLNDAGDDDSGDDQDAGDDLSLDWLRDIGEQGQDAPASGDRTGVTGELSWLRDDGGSDASDLEGPGDGDDLSLDWLGGDADEDDLDADADSRLFLDTDTPSPVFDTSASYDAGDDDDEDLPDLPPWMQGMEGDLHTGPLQPPPARDHNTPAESLGFDDDGDDDADEADVPFWLVGAGDTGDLPSSEDDFQTPPPQADEDVPEWLAATGGLAQTAAFRDGDADDMPDWMDQVPAQPGGTDDSGDDDANEADVPFWLVGAGDTGDLPSSEDDFQTPPPQADEDVPEWLAATGGLAQTAAFRDGDADDMPDWMDQVPAQPSGTDDSGDDDADEADVPFWLSGETGALPSSEDQPEPDPEPDSEDLPEWLKATGELSQTAAFRDEAQTDMPDWVRDADERRQANRPPMPDDDLAQPASADAFPFPQDEETGDYASMFETGDDEAVSGPVSAADEFDALFSDTPAEVKPAGDDLLPAWMDSQTGDLDGDGDVDQDDLNALFEDAPASPAAASSGEMNTAEFDTLFGEDDFALGGDSDDEGFDLLGELTGGGAAVDDLIADTGDLDSGDDFDLLGELTGDTGGLLDELMEDSEPVNTLPETPSPDADAEALRGGLGATMDSGDLDDRFLSTDDLGEVTPAQEDDLDALFTESDDPFAPVTDGDPAAGLSDFFFEESDEDGDTDAEFQRALELTEDDSNPFEALDAQDDGGLSSFFNEPEDEDADALFTDLLEDVEAAAPRSDAPKVPADSLDDLDLETLFGADDEDSAPYAPAAAGSRAGEADPFDFEPVAGLPGDETDDDSDDAPFAWFPEEQAEGRSVTDDLDWMQDIAALDEAVNAKTEIANRDQLPRDFSDEPMALGPDDSAILPADDDFLADLQPPELETIPGTGGEESSGFSNVEDFLASIDEDGLSLPNTGDLEDVTNIDLDMDMFADVAPPELDEDAPPEFSPDAPAWLADVSTSVSTISAGAIVRGQKDDRPLEDLPPRLQALHERGDQLPPSQSGTVTAALRDVLPDVRETLPPASFEITSAEAAITSGANLTTDQQSRVAALQAIAGTGGAAMAAAGAVMEGEDEAEPRRRLLGRRAGAGTRPRLRVDRIVIALLLLAAVALPFLDNFDSLRLGELPPAGFAAGSLGGDFYQQVQAVEPGERVLVAVEYGPTGAAELDPASDTVLRHLLLNGAVPVVVGGNPTGLLRVQALLAIIEEDVAEVAPIEANRDYVIGRYLVGDITGLRNLSENVAALTGTDINGRDTGLDLDSLDDFALIVVIAERADGVRAWAEQVAPQTTTPLIAAVGAGASPLALPYLDAVDDNGGEDDNTAIRGLLVGYGDAYTYREMIVGPGLPGFETTPEPQPSPTPTPTEEPSPTATVTPQPTEDDAADDAADDAESIPGGLPPSEGQPTDEALATPTDEPTPTEEPTAAPTDEPTATPTEEPTATPTEEPTATDEPSVTPTATPTLTLTLTPDASPTSPFATTRFGVVTSTTPRINVRGDPSTNNPPVGSLAVGDRVRIIGENADASWFEVELTDAEGTVIGAGWVAATLLRIEVEVAPSAPTATVEPTATPEDAGKRIAGHTLPGKLRAQLPPSEPTTEPEAAAELETTPEPDPILAAFFPEGDDTTDRDGRWYAMTLGLVAAILVILTGTVFNVLRDLRRRREAT